MSNSSSLIVVVPRLFERLPAAASNGSVPTDSLVAYLAGRGDIAQRWHATHREDARLRPWQRGLLAALQLDARRYPSAPVSAIGQGLADGSADWLHAEPIHLAAGLNEVTLVPLTPDLELMRDQRDAMTAVLQEHVVTEGWTLRPSASNAWFVGAPSELDVSTVTSGFARASEWNTALPHGPAAPRLRRLMTELQMLLHEHPVNEARAARGLPVVNSLWLWGSGRPEPTRATAVFDCVGNDDYLRGVCALNEWRLPVNAASAEATLDRLSGGGSLVCVLDDCDPEQLERDWLVPFVAALSRNRLDRLELVLDEWLLTIDRWRLRRFWRRPLPLQAWAAT